MIVVRVLIAGLLCGLSVAYAAGGGEENVPPIDWSGRVWTQFAYSTRDSDPAFPFNRKEAGWSSWHTLGEIRGNKSFDGVRLKGSVKLDDAKLHGNDATSRYERGVRDKSRTRLELGETYVDARLADGVWLRHGCQVVSWGSSEAFRVSDVMSPRDDRFWAQEDTEDARLPVWASRLTIGRADWETEAVLLHRFRGNRISGTGSDFDPYILDRQRGLDVVSPERPDAKTEYGLRALRRFDGADIGVLVGEVFERDATLHFDAFNPATGLHFVPRYGRTRFIGVTGNLVSDSWLFKGELVQKHGVSLFRDDFFTVLASGRFGPSVATKTVTEALIGAEYTGLPSTILSAEIYGRHVHGYESGLRGKRNGLGGMVSATRSFLNDRLRSVFRYVHFAGDAGKMVYAKVGYDIFDGSEIGVAYIDYRGGDSSLGFLHPQRYADSLLLTFKTYF